MKKTPTEPLIIDLIDVFAFVIKKAISIFLICVLGAMIGIGFHYYSASSEKSVEEYNILLDEYTISYENAEKNLKLLKNRRSILVESGNEDPIFELYNASTIYVGMVSFFISSENDVLVSDSGNLIYPNQERLVTYFESLDYSKILNKDSKNEYLSRIVICEASNNHITIKAFNQNMADATEWANSIFEELNRFAVIDNGWSIIGKTETTETYNGSFHISIVEDYNKERNELDAQISEQSYTVRTLSKQKPHLYHFFKFGVIGFILSGIIACLFVFLRHLKLNPVTKSFIAEKKIDKPFFGALFASNGIFDKLARSIIGERKFSSESEAIEYIKGNIRNTSLKDDAVKNVAILCSCKSKYVEKPAKNLESVLSEFGCKVTLVTDVSVNPESADVVSATDAVILLERQWESQWKLVGVSMDLAEWFNKPVVGFVLC